MALSKADLSILIRVRDEASAAFRDVREEIRGMEGDLKDAGRRMTAAGSSLTAGLTLPIAGLSIVAVKLAADFETVLSEIKAVGGASEEETASLAKLALQLGKDTTFSAKQAAEGMRELVKGGVDVSDILGGAATAALNLAAAGGVDVAEAARIAAISMSLFNIEGSEMGKVVDSIAGFANATVGSVSDFQYALAAVGAVAKLAGQDFDQTATAIALLGKAGILGSDAGTSLKTTLNNLIPTTDRAKEAMMSLGLLTVDTGGKLVNAFVNADGSFKNLRDIAGELNRATKDLTESERSLALETIFGADAIRAAAILAQAGAEGFDEMAEAMGKVSAETVAAERMNNLNGAIEQLRGSLETAAIILGQRFTPTLKTLADATTAFVNDSLIPAITAFTELPQPVQIGVIALVALLAAIGPILLALGFMATGMSAIIGLAPVFGAAITVATGPVGIITIAVIALVAALVLLATHWDEATGAVANAHKAFEELPGPLQFLLRLLPGFGILMEISRNWEAVATATDGARETLVNLYTWLTGTFFGEVGGGFDLLGRTVQNALTGIKNSVVETLNNLISKINDFLILLSKVPGVGGMLPGLVPTVGSSSGGTGAFAGSASGSIGPPSETPIPIGEPGEGGVTPGGPSGSGPPVGGGGITPGGPSAGPGIPPQNPYAPSPPIEGPGYGPRGFQHGGIVRQPTMALIGEAGPEAVVPLSRAGGIGDQHFHFHGPVYGFDDFQRKVEQAVRDSKRRGGL